MANPLSSILDALGDGRIIRRTVTVALYVLGVLIAVAGAIGVLMTLSLTVRMGTTPDVMIGGVLYSMILAAATVAIFLVFWYRAEKVDQLGSSAFTVIPVMSIMFRLVGEVYAVALLALGIGGFILNLFGATFISGSNPFSSAPLLSGWTGATTIGLVGGLTTLALAALGAFAILLIFYFFAEAILIAADIARNVQLLVGTQQATLLSGPASIAPTRPTDVSAPDRAVSETAAPSRAGVLSLSLSSPSRTSANSRCPRCRAEVIETGSIFCANCGARFIPDTSTS